MKCWFAISIAAAIAGCAAYTPQQLVDEGKQRAHQSAQPPVRVAGCIARNIENSSDAMTATVREGPGAGDYEVVLRVPRMVTRPNNAVFRVATTAQGSQATLFVRPDISDETTDALARNAFSGC